MPATHLLLIKQQKNSYPLLASAQDAGLIMDKKENSAHQKCAQIVEMSTHIVYKSVSTTTNARVVELG